MYTVVKVHTVVVVLEPLVKFGWSTF